VLEDVVSLVLEDVVSLALEDVVFDVTTSSSSPEHA